MKTSILIETLGEKFGTRTSLLTTCLYIQLMYVPKLLSSLVVMNYLLVIYTSKKVYS